MHFLRRFFFPRRNRKQASLNKLRTGSTRRKTLLENLESRNLLAGDFGFAHGLGSTSVDLARSVAADSEGNVYVTGEFRGTVDFDSSAATTNLVSPSGLPATFIAKYTADGSLAWAKQFTSTAMNWGEDLTVDSSGNLWVVGQFFGATDFDPGAGQVNLSPRNAAENYLVKFDTNGSLLSAGSVQGGLFDGVASDQSGNVYLTGQFQNTADLDPGAGTSNFTSNGDFDVYLCKVDASGNLIWAKTFGGTIDNFNGDYGQDIAIDLNGNAFVTGVFLGTVDFDPGAGTVNRTSTGSTAVFTTKFDTNGSFQWVAVIDSAGVDPEDIIADADGNVITTGGTQQTVDFDPGAGVFNLTAPNGFFGAYVVKLDGSGSFQWAKELGATANNGTYGYGLSLGANGDIFSTGQFSGTGDFDPGTGAFNMTSAGSIDVYVSRLTSGGNFVSARAMGGTGLDRGRAIAFSSAASGVYTAGQFNGTADFDPGAGTVSKTSHGSDDLFVAKLYTAPYFTSATVFAVDENTTQVGTLAATDPEGDAVTYGISGGADAALFSVDSGTGALTFKTPPDFEDPAHGPSYAIQVTASDGANVGTANLTINVNDVNEAPTLLELSANSASESDPAGTIVGTFSTTDPDVGDTFEYSLVAGEGDEGNAAFVIEGNVLKTAQSFLGAAGTYSIRVHSQDADGLSIESTFTITVVADNHAPTAIALQDGVVAENQPAGTAAGTLSTTDQDAGDSFTYELVAGDGDDDNAAFTISGNTVLTAASFNFEVKDEYSIRVRSTDSGNQWVEETFEINVTDANDLPSGSVVLTGSPSEDEILSADASGVDDEDGLEDLHYQWQRSGDDFATVTNVGTDSAQYVTGDADVGMKIRVVVSYVDDGGTSESLPSAALGPIANVNDAPALNNALNPSLGSIQEDVTNPAGKLVSALLAGAVTDPDPNALRGIGVTSASGFNGTWQYSTNGTTWQDFGTLAAGDALLVPAYARIRFVPKLNFNGPVTIGYRAWDQTEGGVGQTLAISGHTGVANSLSSDSESATLTINAVNDQPVLNTALNPTLGTIAEDTRFPPGVNVSSLISGAITDPDGLGRGIAIVSAPSTYGVWQYRVGGNNTWLTLGNVSESLARLLPSTAGTQVRFIPNAEFSGVVRLYYRAWDRTQGSPGGTFDAGANLGSSKAFSKERESAPLTITTVNDLPVIKLSGAITYVHDKPPITLAAFATVSDVDSANFGGGQLRVRISDGANSSNRLAIGDGFTIDSHKNVKQGATIIGKLTSNGFGTNELVVTFNFAAKVAVVQQLIRSITFRTVGGTAGSRTVLFSVSDGDGGTSAEVAKTVNVV